MGVAKKRFVAKAAKLSERGGASKKKLAEEGIVLMFLKSCSPFKIKTITTDEKNRTRIITYSDGTVETIRYTMTGKVESAKSKTGLINYSYNKAGLLIKQEDTNAGEIAFFAYFILDSSDKL